MTYFVYIFPDLGGGMRFDIQGSHRLENYLNVQDCENKICFEKYLKNTQRP